ncbi:hypothetical protein ACWEOG_03790 [Amycolatopsis japonica]
MDDTDTVRVPMLEYRALIADAGAWRLLNTSPHVAHLLAEWIEWDRRATARATSNAICGGAAWRAIAGGPSYAELARRRAVHTTEPLTPDQIRARATASWARVETWIAARTAA